MSATVIKVEELGKLYKIGEVGTGTLSHDLNRWWAKIRGREDPLAKVGDINNRSKGAHNDYVWALKNINFELQQGEVLGVVGHNGAGKSTLLKLLSKITTPSTGRIKIRGRVASLLEVGTGFHPELTGRENIFLNGAILGMTKAEIRKKLSEIVDFAGVERYIDTPVKRYSSGMYVRLAFAVAAFLDPEILIVDEVLAVGDAEFQKKCLNKMQAASRQSSRTIIFVSHNMQAVSTLCRKSIWLQNGQLVQSGDTQMVIHKYLGAFQRKIWKQEWESIQEAPGNEIIRLRLVELIPRLPDPLAPIDVRTPLTVKFRFHNLGDEFDLTTDLVLFTLAGECIFDLPSREVTCKKGLWESEYTIPGHFLNDGSYYFSIYFTKNETEVLYYHEACLHFDVQDYHEYKHWFGKWMGYTRPQFPVALHQVME